MTKGTFHLSDLADLANLQTQQASSAELSRSSFLGQKQFSILQNWQVTFQI